MHYDVIVIGVGSMGSSACWFLARNGVKVLGLEQFDPPHDRGSHSGQSRITRQAYFEHSDYVPLLQRAFQNQAEFERESSVKIFHRTGILYAGHSGSTVISGVLRSAETHRLEVEELSASEARRRHPGLAVPEDFRCLFESGAGFLTPEKTIAAYVSEATKKGAVIRTGEPVSKWSREGDGFVVETARAKYSCARLVITAGSWTSRLLPQLTSRLTVTRQMLGWVQPREPKLFTLGNFPCWFADDAERGAYYGFPLLAETGFDGPRGLKLAHHVHGPVADPDAEETMDGTATEHDLRYALSKYLPEANGPITAIRRCLYTNTPDENFIIDYLPEFDNKVVVACGFSGHGFKFVPVVGEILCDLATKGSTNLPIGFLRLSRF